MLLVPAPDSGICRLELEALLEIRSVPVAGPAAVGSNPTETVTDWFGATTAFAPPLALKPDPVVVTFEIVTFSLPVTVSVINSDPDEPTFTFPKLIPLELGEIWEGAVVFALLELGLVPARE